MGSVMLLNATLAIFIVTSFARRQAAFLYLAIAQSLPAVTHYVDFLAVTLGPKLLIQIGDALLTLSLGFIVIAALDRSMGQFEEPSGPTGARLGKWRLGNLIAPIILGPITLILAMTDRVHVSPFVSSGFTVALALFVVVHLITMVQARASSTHWASHDKLTGLPNRALFRERTAQALDQAKRFNHAVAVMYLDLDRFKHINDSLGHEAGDQLLEQVARRILTCVDPSDTVARLGGDEFAILLPSVEGDRVPRMLAKRLLKTFAPPFQLKPRPVFMTPSIGISLGDGSESLEALFTQADTAMYRAKEMGRNNFEVWSQAMTEESHQRLLLETYLHSAVANDQMRLVYQPKVNLKTGVVVGVEALVRWHHPKLGVISPAVFIHLAEESGLINQIGEWVLQTACAQAKAWHDTGFSNVTMAVNLSSRQFQNQNVADLVSRILRETELVPSLLELELTESLAMSGDEATLNTLLELRSMGVKTSIDDFGTGYSNLSYLSRFPVDKLKIDRAFIEQIDKSGGDAAIVVAVIAMAHGLGLGVIAEGVETADQASFLAAHGCDELQGFLFSKPLPPDELEGLLMLENVAGGGGRLGAPGALHEALGLTGPVPAVSAAFASTSSPGVAAAPATYAAPAAPAAPAALPPDYVSSLQTSTPRVDAPAPTPVTSGGYVIPPPPIPMRKPSKPAATAGRPAASPLPLPSSPPSSSQPLPPSGAFSPVASPPPQSPPRSDTVSSATSAGSFVTPPTDPTVPLSPAPKFVKPEFMPQTPMPGTPTQAPRPPLSPHSSTSPQQQPLPPSRPAAPPQGSASSVGSAPRPSNPANTPSKAASPVRPPQFHFTPAQPTAPEHLPPRAPGSSKTPNGHAPLAPPSPQAAHPQPGKPPTSRHFEPDHDDQ